MSSDFIWHCNAHPCRVELKTRAVVTTCSHIFCLPCAETQGLASSTNGVRICPACEARLVNQDDAVIAQLDPTEDYKTSVLSGLHPAVIMECAGRAIAFYSYQVSNEITYQSYLSSSLTDKYASVNNQLDTIISQANGQIKKLQDALKESNAKHAEFEKKNWELHEAFKAKAKGFTELNKKYNMLKDEKMKGQVMEAASDDADRVVHTVSGNRYVDRPDRHGTFVGQFSRNRQGEGQSFRRPLSGTSGDSEERRGLRGETGQAWYGQQPPRHGYTSQSQIGVHATPSTHRTHLPMAPPRGSGSYTADVGFQQPPNGVHRKPFVPPGMTGYGMSAGLKMGKQRPLTSTGSRRQRPMGPPDLPVR